MMFTAQLFALALHAPRVQRPFLVDAARRAPHLPVATAIAPTTIAEEVPGLLRMARLNAAPMGAIAVALGARGARHTASTLPGDFAARMTLGVLLTMIVTVGSMLINDYHDHREGVDNEQTKPGRPLVTGEVRPATVKRVLKWGYATHLILLCLVDAAPMRLWILANTLLTYLYSVHLKPVTFVKNLACAAIVAMAIGLGGLAAHGLPGLASGWRPMAAVLGLIWHREIVMDIKDKDGDALAGVQTLPVKYGANTAFWLSLLPLSFGVLAAGSSAAPIAALPLLLQAFIALRAQARAFDQASLHSAIELAPVWLLATTVALTK